VKRGLPALLAVFTLAPVAVASGGPAPAAVSAGALQACASIAEDAARLACYDRLAGRVASQAVGQVTAPASPGAVHVPAQPAAAASASPAAPTPPTQAAATSVPPSAAAAPLPKESFGLYAAEHPKPAAAAALEAAVVALGTSPNGRMTVTLEGGAVWELQEPDNVLAVGELVTITRASLGSYLMQTPTHRTHRVRRLR